MRVWQSGMKAGEGRSRAGSRALKKYLVLDGAGLVSSGEDLEFY